MPLLIGGATTSRAHTAVKIAPNYDKGVVYVTDASRAVGVTNSLVSDEKRGPYLADISADYARRCGQAMKKAGAQSRRVYLLPRPVDNRLQIDWANYAPPKPSFLGAKAFRNYDLAELARYIDWTPFFAAWDLHGRYPQILKDDKVGEAARSLFDDAQTMLAKIIDEKPLTAHGVVRVLAGAGATGTTLSCLQMRRDLKKLACFTVFASRWRRTTARIIVCQILSRRKGWERMIMWAHLP